MTVLLLLLSFVLIIVGALLFTNAIEWAGHRLGMGQGAVGSLLAAVGTALPESLIPIVALISGVEGSTEVAIGSIIGAPFMLGTIAMCLVGISTVAFQGRRESGKSVRAHIETVRRDLVFFMVFFALGIALGLGTSSVVQIVGGAVLVVAYVVFVWFTIRGGGEVQEDLRSLTFDPTKHDPPTNWQIGLQVVVGLALIIGGAELFVEEIIAIAESLGVEPLVLSLILAPLATELPEKANSFLWIRESKDSLAIGNITGAMAFQSTVPVALGMFFTEWSLDQFAVAAGVLGVAGGALALWRLHQRQLGTPSVVAWGVLFAAFVVFVSVA